MPAPADAPDDTGPESRIYLSQRLRLHYLDWGNPHAPTLILQHGGLDHARSWDWVARALRHDWHVIAPDLRGHGDSAWSADGAYLMPYHVYDFTQLIHHLNVPQVTIVGHSLGGAIAMRHAGLYPETVDRIVSIEGLGLSPEASRARYAEPADARWRAWIEECRALGGRVPRRYASVAEALARLHGQHPHLSEAQALHLTVHGLRRNEDGSYGWKYDNMARSNLASGTGDEELHALWHRIPCPVLLAYGAESWASNPAEDGRAGHFRNARVALFEGAGHWLHHDRFDAFLAELRVFLAEPPPPGAMA